jgi:hypothetical protein
VIVIVVVLAVVVKPRLHTLGEVLMVIRAGVLTFSQAGRPRCLVGRFEPSIKGRVDVHHSNAHEITSPFVRVR